MRLAGRLIELTWLLAAITAMACANPTGRRVALAVFAASLILYAVGRYRGWFAAD
jgi:hypothetical protein